MRTFVINCYTYVDFENTLTAAQGPYTSDVIEELFHSTDDKESLSRPGWFSRPSLIKRDNQLLKKHE